MTEPTMPVPDDAPEVETGPDREVEDAPVDPAPEEVGVANGGYITGEPRVDVEPPAQAVAPGSVESTSTVQ